MGMPTEAGKHDEREPRGGTSAEAVIVVPERAGEGARPARAGDDSVSWIARTCLQDRRPTQDDESKEGTFAFHRPMRILCALMQEPHPWVTTEPPPNAR